MNRHPDIDHLISLYLSGNASEKEKQELEEWIWLSEDNREAFEHLKSIWNMNVSNEHDPEIDRVGDRIWAEGTKPSSRTHDFHIKREPDVFYWIKIAAVLVVFLFGAWLFSYFSHEEATIPTEVVAMIEKSNPSGQRSRHMLPDGTRVWLNSESSLTYPEIFPDTIRLIRLEGEAFFEVAKDTERSFIVESGGIQTKAIGTSFNVNAVPEQPLVKIALLEGKVSVEDTEWHKTAILQPGEELFAPGDDKDFIRQPFDYEKSFGWKDGILLFDGVSFGDFKMAIEKWYGVNVNTRGIPPSDWKIRARYRNETLKNVLSDIGFNKNVKFEIKDKNVVITF